MEEWSIIPGFSRYAVSNHGRIKSLPGRWKSEHVMKVSAGYGGYTSLHLFNDESKNKHMRTHVLVMLAFVGLKPDGMEIRHLDGNPANNRLGNLAYGTSLENSEDILRHGTGYQLQKTHCPSGHEYTPDNTGRATRVRKSGRVATFRICRECRRLKGWPVPRPS